MSHKEQYQDMLKEGDVDKVYGIKVIDNDNEYYDQAFEMFDGRFIFNPSIYIVGNAYTHIIDNVPVDDTLLLSYEPTRLVFCRISNGKIDMFDVSIFDVMLPIVHQVTIVPAVFRGILKERKNK